MTSLTVGVLVVSTSVAEGSSVDASRSVLGDFFTNVNSESSAAQWTVKNTAVVSDDVDKIQDVIRRWADEEKINLIVTTGGTGFAVTDGTPEVCCFFVVV